MNPIIFIVLSATTLFGGCTLIDIGNLAHRDLVEYTVDDNAAEHKIALIDLSGELRGTAKDNQGPFGQQDIVHRTKEQLDKAAADPTVKAVVLRVSSPGGEVFPSLSLYREIVRFREETGKPVVAYVAAMAASGGYMAALGAQEIVADPISLTGSIGVIAMVPNMTGFMEWARIKIHTFKKGERKDVANPFRELTEQDAAELDKLLSYYYATFVRLVGESRKLSGDELAAVTDGGVFTSDAALANGLVDKIGDVFAAHERAAQLAGVDLDATNIVIYRLPREAHTNIYAAMQAGNPLAGIDLGVLAPLQGARFMYMWQPGAGTR